MPLAPTHWECWPITPTFPTSHQPFFFQKAIDDRDRVPSPAVSFLDFLSAFSPGSPVSRPLSAPCPLSSLRFITCVPLLSRDLSGSPRGLSLRDVGQSPPSPPAPAPLSSLSGRQGLPRSRVVGLHRLGPCPGLQRMFWLLLAQLLERIVLKLLKLDCPAVSSSHKSLTTAWGLQRLPPGRRPAWNQSLRRHRDDHECSLPACTELDTCCGLSPRPLAALGGGYRTHFILEKTEAQGAIRYTQSYSAGRWQSWNSNLRGLMPRRHPAPSPSVLHLQEQRDSAKGWIHSLHGCPTCHGTRTGQRGVHILGKEGKTPPRPGTVPGLADRVFAEWVTGMILAPLQGYWWPLERRLAWCPGRVVGRMPGASLVPSPPPLLPLWAQPPSSLTWTTAMAQSDLPALTFAPVPPPLPRSILNKVAREILLERKSDLVTVLTTPSGSHLTQSEIYSGYHDPKPLPLRRAPVSLPAALPLAGLTGLHHVGLLACITPQPTSTSGPSHQLFSVLFIQVALSPHPLFLQVLLKCLFTREAFM